MWLTTGILGDELSVCASLLTIVLAFAIGAIPLGALTLTHPTD
jgi:hypothetical protein